MKKIILLFAFILSLGVCNAEDTIRYNETLTTPSFSTAFDTTAVDNHSYYITTTGISTNIILQFQASADGTNFANIDSLNNNYTITSNGTFLYEKKNLSTLISRLYWVSKSGEGTTPNVVLKYVGRRGGK